jgi:hypothetical protein
VYRKVYTFKRLFGLFVTVLFLEGAVAIVQTKRASGIASTPYRELQAHNSKASSILLL